MPAADPCREHAGGALEHAGGVHCGALDETESGVVPNRLGETDPAVGGVLAAEARGDESLGIAEQALSRLAAALEIGAERRRRAGPGVRSRMRVRSARRTATPSCSVATASR